LACFNKLQICSNGVYWFLRHLVNDDYFFISFRALVIWAPGCWQSETDGCRVLGWIVLDEGDQGYLKPPQWCDILVSILYL
jgi:hypothetical protein